MFLPFLQNDTNADFDQRDGHGKLRNSHGNVMENQWKEYLQSMGTLMNSDNHYYHLSLFGALNEGS